MDISRIPVGRNPPYDLNVIVESSVGDVPVKYELDKGSGAMLVDRVIQTAVTYSGNYGFIPHTLSSDGDPVDVIVVARHPAMPGAGLPIGVLLMEDEQGEDETILAVPVGQLKPDSDEVLSYEDLPGDVGGQIAHFFALDQDLEDGKRVRIIGWEGLGKGVDVIRAEIEWAKASGSPAAADTLSGKLPMTDLGQEF